MGTSTRSSSSSFHSLQKIEDALPDHKTMDRKTSEAADKHISYPSPTYDEGASMTTMATCNIEKIGLLPISIIFDHLPIADHQQLGNVLHLKHSSATRDQIGAYLPGCEKMVTTFRSRRGLEAAFITGYIKTGRNKSFIPIYWNRVIFDLACKDTISWYSNSLTMKSGREYLLGLKRPNDADDEKWVRFMTDWRLSNDRRY